MMGEFTFERYEELLRAGLDAGYDHLTVRQYLTRKRADELPERFVVHRHDVDRKPENALAMARLEARLDVPSTYYFRTIEKVFRPDLIRQIDALGHEIGYHYEDMDRAEGDVAAAHDSFRSELERLRELAEVRTACMHGNPLTSYDNRDMWASAPEGQFEEYGLLGEAYLSMDFADVIYFSDTGRTWEDGALKIKDHTVGEDGKQRQVGETSELIGLLENREIPRLCLLTHPNRWAKDSTEMVVENAKDFTMNAGKRVLNLVR
ncbi:polysaccharide deacetylase family protein [Halopelagius longus]|uniref:Polysaccharide deacetylase n=2 Tax=Halopelagius longus TaxID=1236180 RepID=A0A1H1GJN1_9EURY|nr:hypothetical protein [Halopelagius longus]RDI69716.1 hypothetical protein DWB78_18270 [Halopelagius longus]SDR13096.1 hypothetical protein SAMN05216278_3699 [Halopelagius longus]